VSSAMRGRHEGLREFSGVCKTPANGGILLAVLFSTFQFIYSGCCTDGKACIRTKSGMIAIGLEGRDSTKRSHDASHVCALLPRVGLKEVNITKQGGMQP
jgi:hypothetical protein